MPATTSLTIAPLGISDVAAASSLFARAFDNDAMARLLCPGRAERRRFQERGGRSQIEKAMPYRHVFGAYENQALRGIAVWLPPGVSVPSFGAPPLRSVPRLAATIARTPRDVIRLVRNRQRALAAAHATPSWYLAFLATDPDHQRRGIGRQLLNHVLTRADADDTPVWLETSDPVNVPIYQRFGFGVTTHLASGPHLPTFWVMVRPPGRAPRP
jgi:ribosomal protein S18 acetylase RimI-like enzyme